MRKVIFGIILTFFIYFLAPLPYSFAQEEGSASAQTPFADEFYRGEVIAVIREYKEEISGRMRTVQQVVVRVDSGPDAGREITIEHGKLALNTNTQVLSKGDDVVLTKSRIVNETLYYISDVYRIPSILYVFGIFFLLVVAIVGWKGLSSMIGLVFSTLIIIYGIVPNLSGGFSPVLVTFAGSVVIATVSLYLAHGFNRRTSVAYASTLITLAISTLLAMFFVYLSRLTGGGTEEAFFLQLGPLDQVDLRGLLLGGMILGMLGVLDDVTTSQAATVAEISRANHSFDVKELFTRGLRVGREHIASLVNTLFLAYAGVSLPLFLLFTINRTEPWWVLLNSEFIVEEIVRTLVGSVALILAVPITTILAAFFLRAKDGEHHSHGSHSHGHVH